MKNSAEFLCLKRTSVPAEHGPPDLNKYFGHLMMTENVAADADQEVEVVVLLEAGDNVSPDEWPVSLMIPAEFLTDERLFEQRILIQAA